MRIRKLDDCDEFIAGDGTHLRELLHPDKEYEFDGRYSLAYATVDRDEKSQPHILTSSEVYYILSGSGIMYVDDEHAEISAGTVIEIPAGACQWVENIGDAALCFLCIVDPAWRAEDEQVLSEQNKCSEL